MEPEAAFVSVYVTAADAAAAAHLARAIVAERLAACANVLPAVQSVYRWQGEIAESAEAAVIFKTRAALVPSLEARVRALHAYALPCVVAWPIVGGSAAYLAWIAAETAAATAAPAEDAPGLLDSAGDSE